MAKEESDENDEDDDKGNDDKSEDCVTTGKDRGREAAKQLFCGGLAGSVAKTVTAPLSRLTILFQVHSLVTTKNHRPKFAMSVHGGFSKIIERGGIISLWKGNMTSVLHRFPYSAINFFVYENSMDILSSYRRQQRRIDEEEAHETAGQLVRRVTQREDLGPSRMEETMYKFTAGALAGMCAVTACYPLDLIRTRLSTELEGKEHYRGIVDAMVKIYRTEGITGFYAGIGPTLLVCTISLLYWNNGVPPYGQTLMPYLSLQSFHAQVAVPNFSISYTVYGSLKEYMIDDDLFYNLRRIDADGEPRLGGALTIACGAFSGILASLVTFPMDTIRRRMQVQNLHITDVSKRLNSYQQMQNLIHKEGLWALYRGLTPELLKVVPMVGTMFFVYEEAKQFLNVSHDR